MSAQGPAPGRIGKRKGARAVWAPRTASFLSAEALALRPRLGGAHLGTPRRFRQREEVRRAQSTVAAGRIQGAFGRPSGHIEHDSRRRFQKASSPARATGTTSVRSPTPTSTPAATTPPSSYYSCSMVIIVMHTLLTLLEPFVLIQ